MNLILLNISASIMILTALFIHKIFKKHVPHGVFCILWLVIILRLFFPIKLETRLSLWNLIIKSEHVVADFTNLPISHGYTAIADFVQNNSFVITPIYKIIWCTVCSAVGIFFLSQYIKTLKAIKTSSYINDNFINDVISRQNFYRHVNIKSMKGISSPSTLGIIRPTILFPESFDFGDKNTLECILLHETGHIRHFHTLYKILSTVLVCLYWYNPFVWLMYFSLDIDMEITADRYVVKKLGGEKKAFYANILISAAGNTNKRVVFYFHFKRKLIKERIEAIMNFKKLSFGALIVTVLVPSCVFTAFGTTDAVISGIELSQTPVKVESVEYDTSAETMADMSLDIPWEELEPYVSQDNAEKALDSYEIIDYKYVTYGKMPPTSITVTTTKNGHKYKGTLERTHCVIDDSLDKYTGYYSGTVYLQ